MTPASNIHQGTLDLSEIEGSIEFKLLRTFGKTIFDLGTGISSIVSKLLGLVGGLILFILFSPVILVFLPISFLVYNSLAKKVSGFKTKLLLGIPTMNFEEVVELEKEISSVLKQLHFMNAIARQKVLPQSIQKDIISILADLNSVRFACQAQYRFTFGDFFTDEAALIEYQARMKSFDDVFNYADDSKDDQTVFEIKRSSTK